MKLDEGITSEIILEHYRNPHNHGKIENPTSTILEFNPVCGDTVQITMLIEDEKIKDIKFLGRGCSISQASTSMLTDYVMGKTIEEVKALTKEQVLSFVGLSLGPSREKCALLPFDAIRKGVKQYEEDKAKQ